jgi:hypothetical protein
MTADHWLPAILAFSGPNASAETFPIGKLSRMRRRASRRIVGLDQAGVIETGNAQRPAFTLRTMLTGLGTRAPDTGDRLTGNRSEAIGTNKVSQSKECWCALSRPAEQHHLCGFLAGNNRF